MRSKSWNVTFELYYDSYSFFGLNIVFYYGSVFLALEPIIGTSAKVDFKTLDIKHGIWCYIFVLESIQKIVLCIARISICLWSDLFVRV